MTYLNVPSDMVAIGISLLSVVLILLLRYQRQQAERACNAFEAMENDIDGFVIAADDAISDPRTPERVRATLVYMLQLVSAPSEGREFVEWYVDYVGSKQRRPSGPEGAELEALRLDAPDLYDRISFALNAGTMALMVTHADRMEITEVATHNAVRPTSVFSSLLLKLLSADATPVRAG